MKSHSEIFFDYELSGAGDLSRRQKFRMFLPVTVHAFFTGAQKSWRKGLPLQKVFCAKVQPQKVDQFSVI